MPQEMNKGTMEIFKGLKVVSFGWAVVGPLTMKYLADYGATVIRVETGERPCTLRTSPPYKGGKNTLNNSGYFNHLNSNILSFSLNMSRPEAPGIAKRLISKSDVFMENFAPGIIERWGLDYNEVKKINPDIIMLRQSGFGAYGPYSRMPAFGMILTSLTGIPNFIGWPDREPLPVGVAAYTDYIAPRFATAALIAALNYRRKTGKGQLLDVSQMESAIQFIIPAILDNISNDREPLRRGNSNPFASPHGVFACKGEDRWCTIAVFNEEEWKNLCLVIGDNEYLNDLRFNSLVNRKKYEAEIFVEISKWTATQTAEEVMLRLQTVGVPAGVVKNAEDLYSDPQLRHRGLFWALEHSEMGLFTHLGSSFVLSKTPAKAERPSPLIGEHTEQVCTKILGMPDDEFVELLQAGVFE
jgi:benzylsuccinate CoA-transferase BbsF subunit